MGQDQEKKFAAKKVTVIEDLPTFVLSFLTVKDVTALTSASDSAVSRWKDGKNLPSRAENLKTLSKVAALGNFVLENTALEDISSLGHLLHSHYIDPNTFEPVEYFEHLKKGDFPFIINAAIEAFGQNDQAA